MSDNIEYKSYKAKIAYSLEDDLLVGKVIDVDSLIMFSGVSLDEIKAEFKAAIDSYLADCEEQGLVPEKPFKGSFNVRVGCEAHRKAATTAKAWGISLNEFVRVAIEQSVDRHAPTVDSITVARTSVVATLDQAYIPAKPEPFRRAPLALYAARRH